MAMQGTHVIETVWFNAKKRLPDSPRKVLVYFKHFRGAVIENCLAQAIFYKSKGHLWEVDSKTFNPSFDVVTQWAEIDPKRGGCLPDPFPGPDVGIEYISNLL